MTEVSTYGFPFGPEDIELCLDSSNVHGYVVGERDAEKQHNVWFIFKSGDVYEYRSVTAEHVRDLFEAESVGSFLHRVLMTYPCGKIGNIFEGGVESDD